MNTFLNVNAIPDKSIGKNKLTEEFQSELAQLSDGCYNTHHLF